MSNLTSQNMHTFCRTCLKKPKQKFSIWENEIYKMLASICNYQIIEADDKFPKYVCSKCYRKLRSFIEFRVESLKSHNILANIVSQPYISENQIGTGSNAGSDKSLKNCDRKVENNASESPVEDVKSNYETIFCGDIEPKVEHEINGIDMLPYSSSNSQNTSYGKQKLDCLEIDNEYPHTQNEDELLQNLSVLIHSPNLVDKSDDTDLDVIPEKLSNKIPRILRSKKLISEQKTRSVKHKQKKKIGGTGAPIFQCDQCPRRCVTKENYEAHMRTHQGLKPFLCKECGRSYNRADHWREHVREIHTTTNRQFNCSFEGCDKVFKRESTYRAHYRRKHVSTFVKRESKNYVCEDCGNTYNNITTFKEHRYKHVPIEEYPFNCDECGKKFRSKRRLQEHKWRHTGIKNFVCPHCGMKKATKNELRTHINYHTKERQWPCPKCTSVFNSSANLGMHDRVVHKGIRRFACKYCDQSFGKPDTLKHHEMRHTGEKPHGCEICGKRFIQSVALRTHMKVHNKVSAYNTSKISVAEKSLIST